MENKITLGDKVVHRSNGHAPEMIVVETSASECKCQYFDLATNTFQKQDFHPVELRIIQAFKV